MPVNPDSEADVEAAKRHFDFYIGIFSQPIYGDGKFPDTVRNTISTEFVSALINQEWLTAADLGLHITAAIPHR